MFFSNLAGSILGILGTVGFFMSTIEGKLEEFKSKRTMKHNFNQILCRRDDTFNLNFNEIMMASSQGNIQCTVSSNPLEFSIDEIGYKTDNRDVVDESKNVTTLGIDDTNLFVYKNRGKIVPIQQ